MAVVAALDRERQADAERLDHVRQPRPERDHDVAGVERPGSRIDAPMRMDAVQRARIAGEREPAERGKARGIGARDGERVRYAHRAGPMHGMANTGASDGSSASAASRPSGTLTMPRLAGDRAPATNPRRLGRCGKVSASRCGESNARLPLPRPALRARSPHAQIAAASPAKSRPAATAARKRGTPQARAPPSAKTSGDNWRSASVSARCAAASPNPTGRPPERWCCPR